MKTLRRHLRKVSWGWIIFYMYIVPHLSMLGVVALYAILKTPESNGYLLLIVMPMFCLPFSYWWIHWVDRQYYKRYRKD